MTNNIAGAGWGETGEIYNPALGNTLTGLALANPTIFISRLLSSGVTLILIIGSITFFFMLLFGGIQWISSGGDKSSLEAARGKITNAIIGLVILLSTFAIVSLIELFFGIDILTLDIGSLVIQ